MTTATKKCRNCFEYFPTGKMIKIPMGYLCSKDCLYAIIKKGKTKHRKQAQKQARCIIKRKQSDIKKSNYKRKRKYQKSNRTIRKDATRRSCHKYIRERDKDNRCICCDKIISVGQAGHYLESGSNPKVRYDEDNIHLQDKQCNFFKGGDSGMYRVNLIKKIGIKRVLRLESLKGGLDTRTTSHLLHIEKYYLKKFKNLKT